MVADSVRVEFLLIVGEPQTGLVVQDNPAVFDVVRVGEDGIATVIQNFHHDVVWQNSGHVGHVVRRTIHDCYGCFVRVGEVGDLHRSRDPSRSHADVEDIDCSGLEKR